MNDGSEGPIDPAGERDGEPLPIRLSDDGRTATWNPGLVRAARVVLRVRLQDDTLLERSTMNSGRARVREGERIEAVVPKG